MTCNHRNRSATHLGHVPSADEVREARETAGLTQTEAAALIWCSLRAWQQWEAGDRRMHPAFWELFTIKLQPREAPEPEPPNDSFRQACRRPQADKHEA